MTVVTSLRRQQRHVLDYLSEACRAVTVQGGSKKMSDMRSDGISTKTRLDLIFSR